MHDVCMVLFTLVVEELRASMYDTGPQRERVGDQLDVRARESSYGDEDELGGDDDLSDGDIFGDESYNQARSRIAKIPQINDKIAHETKFVERLHVKVQ